MTDIATGSTARPDIRDRLATANVPDSDDLMKILRWAWRGKWVAIGCSILALVIAMLILSQITPKYTAKAILMLDTRETNVVDVETVLSGLGSTAIDAEVEVLKSTQLLSRVVDKLNLTSDYELNPLITDPGRSTGPVQSVRNLLADLGLMKKKHAASTADPNSRAQKSAVIGTIRQNLEVLQTNGGLVIRLGYTSTDKTKSALIANAVADQYLNDQLEVKYEATRRASSWLTERLDELKSQVERSEAAIENFKANQVATEGQGSGITTQQLSQVNTELITARSRRAEAEARYRQLASRLDDGNPLAVAEVLSSPGVQRLRGELSDLKRQEAELSARYLDLHPKIIKVRAEIGDVENSLRIEIQKVVENLRGELSVARSRENSLSGSLRQIEQRAVTQNQASVGLRQLEREAEANRTVYENFLSRFKETTAQEDLQDADVRIISPAEVPGAPSYPPRLIILAAAAFVGMLIGFGLVVLREAVNTTIRSPKDIEALFGLPTLGSIPLLKRGSKGRRNVFVHVAEKPTSAIAEACRSLRTALLLSNVDRPPEVIMITSSVPSEGKSTLALMLAQTSVSLGKKVLIIDSDLRRSTINSTIGVPNDPSLIDVLSGAVDADAAIYHDSVSGLDILPAKPTSASTVDLLSSQRFNNLIQSFREKYDAVFLDTAPILAVSDALVVGRLADSIIYVVKWDETPRQEISSGLQTLQDANLKVSGIALNQIDTKRANTYGVEGAYYGKYTEYYQG